MTSTVNRLGKTKMRPRHSARASSGLSSDAHSVDSMLTVEQVAQELWLCTRTVRRFIDADALRYHRFGKAIRVSRKDLDAFKRERRN